MTRDEELKEIWVAFKSSHEDCHSGKMGILPILKYLYYTEREVTSKQLSTKLNVSSARMTILLKKLEKENIITKENSTTDARTINVKLTDYGLKRSKEIEHKISSVLNELLDIFGYDKLLSLLNDMKIIQKVFRDEMEREIK